MNKHLRAPWAATLGLMLALLLPAAGAQTKPKRI